jgi:DNA-binding response OmpR family regulator
MNKAVNVCVLSPDRAFAEMLAAELEGMWEKISVSVDKYSVGDIVVLDLDGGSAVTSIDEGDYIIGFSRKENTISKSVLNKCHSVMHRPFLIEDLKKTVRKLAASKNDAEAFMHGESLSEEMVKEKPERLRFDKDCVYLDEKRVGLSGNEYAVLMLLYKNLAAPVSRDRIATVLSSSDGNMCDVYICKLRSKLEKSGSEKFIFTVREKGYMLKI